MAANPMKEEKEICITKDDGKTIVLNIPELKEILCQPDCIDKKVSVVFMSGISRMGKSFLLNYMLRYLRAGGKDDWMGGPDKPLEGFTWGGGIERVTEGVWAWNRIYPLPRAGEEERVVFLVDTETLILLIRNWKYDEDHPFGWQDDRGYIETVFQDLIKSNQGNIPNTLRAMFTTLRSFLLPTIGKAGDGRKVFDGCHSKLDPQFKTYMEKFICGLFDPTSLQTKTIGDCPLTCGDFYNYCVENNKLFMKWGMPELRSIDQANAQLRLEKVRDQCETACKKIQPSPSIQ